MAAFQSVMTEAPQAIELAGKAKDFFAAMFAAGLISKEQQDATRAHVDKITDALNNGEVPPGWEVEPDPIDL